MTLLCRTTIEHLRAPRVYLLGIVSLTAIVLSGCQPEEVVTAYGRRRGTPAAESVNGTAVLAGMFEAAGHRVFSWHRLSPKLDDCQTIVWFPNDYGPPTAEQREFLENWLGSEPGRTLVYVGRDYDAAIDYWKKIQPSAPPGQAVEVARRLALAQAIHDRGRADMSNGAFCDWFTMRRDAPLVSSKPLTGTWASGVDASKVEIQIAGRLEQPSSTEIEQWVARSSNQWRGQPEYEALLVMGDALVAGRLTFEVWDGSQLIFVSNGSFLLNLPLVNHEHRKLAGKLIVACGPPGRVAFLESDKGGPPILDREPNANAPTGFEVFTVWPMGVILVHLTALGILACVALFPIFGRPRELPKVSGADFGQHVEALGELLQETGDREYAGQKLKAYQEHVRRDSSSAPSN